jgi:hypothetical protein
VVRVEFKRALALRSEISASMTPLSDFEEFVRDHRPHGQMTGDATEPTANGYRPTVACACGVVFERWVAPADADADPVRWAALNGVRLDPPGRICVRAALVRAHGFHARPRAVPPRRLGVRGEGTGGGCSRTRTATASACSAGTGAITPGASPTLPPPSRSCPRARSCSTARSRSTWESVVADDTSRAYLLPPEESSQRLAGFIVDSLLDAGIVARKELDRAVSVVAEEIDANEAMADYWCMDCGRR